jgi:hypothetical protein
LFRSLQSALLYAFSCAPPLLKSDSNRKIENVDKTEYEKLSKEKQRHFYKCRECGEMVDKRQLDDVVFHEDHKQRPDIQYSGGERLFRCSNA